MDFQVQVQVCRKPMDSLGYWISVPVMYNHRVDFLSFCFTFYSALNHLFYLIIHVILKIYNKTNFETLKLKFFFMKKIFLNRLKLFMMLHKHSNFKWCRFIKKINSSFRQVHKSVIKSVLCTFNWNLFKNF